MTTPVPFSLTRRLSRPQIIFGVVTGVLAVAVNLLLLSVYINILSTNVAFNAGYIITDLADIQRAILQLRDQNNRTLSQPDPDFESLALRRALVNSQMRLALSEAAGNDSVTQGLRQLQESLEEYDVMLATLQANPSSQQVAVIGPELDRILEDLAKESKDFNNHEETQFFTTISDALRNQRNSQTFLVAMGGLLLVFSVMLLLSLRRTVSSEFAHAYQLLEAEVTERKQAEERLRKSHLELAMANTDLKSLNDQLQAQLNLAREIQQSLLPPARPNWNDLDLVCHSIPALEVGGDFYTYHRLDEDHYTLAVGDVSGKGLPAALLMATTLAYYESTFAFALSPDDLLVRLDRALVRHTKTTRQNCALCYVELHGLSLSVANAGGIPPYIRRKNGKVEELEVGGMPLGVGLGANTGYRAVTVKLDPGDLIILSSDGLAEANITTDRLFSFDRLEQALAAGPTTSAQAMLEHLKAEVTAFMGDTELHDDLTIVVIQVSP